MRGRRKLFRQPRNYRNERPSIGVLHVAHKGTGITITASASSLNVPLNEKSVAGPPASVSYVSGSRQFAPPQTPLPNLLVVAVKDQYKNLVTGATVTFSDNGAGGTFSPSALSLLEPTAMPASPTSPDHKREP